MERVRQASLVWGPDRPGRSLVPVQGVDTVDRVDRVDRVDKVDRVDRVDS